MKSEKEVTEMYDFIGFFNDGQFMNRDFRNGIQAALSFVLYDNQQLETIKRKCLNLNTIKDNKTS